MDFGHFLVSFPQDSGPIYQETLQGRLPVEPFNTYSNILFLLIIIYFSVKVYPQARKQAFLAWCLPILFLGYVGVPFIMPLGAMTSGCTWTGCLLSFSVSP